MSPSEFRRISGFWKAKVGASRWTGVSRRASKNVGRAVGQVLKSSHVIPQVSLNRHFSRVV